MKNGRCRMHGGTSPGAPKGEAHGSYRHGLYTGEAIKRRRLLKAWIQKAQATIEQI